VTHGAVENEVDGVVDECRDVHDVAEGRVERREVNWLQAADQCKDALRKLNCVNSTDISVGRERPSGTVTTVKKTPVRDQTRREQRASCGARDSQ